MDINEVLKHLPHRFPFLLIDRVIEIVPEKFIHAIKNVTVNEPHFCGHWPERPVMPGVLILEALAQAACVLAVNSTGGNPREDEVFFFAAIDNARFKRVVVPGDQLHLYIEVTRARRDVLKVLGTAKVDDEVVCTAELMSVRKRIQTSDT